MGSTADQPSYEASQYGQGVLTYALLEGLRGAGLQKPEDYIDVQTLFRYAERRVPELARNIGGVQKPINSSPLGKTFVIGQMNETDKAGIKLPALKPVFLRPNLTAPSLGNRDPLRLTTELRKRLAAEGSYFANGNREPKLIYFDDSDYPNGIELTGAYEIEGETVRATLRLFRGEKELTPQPLTVSGAKDDVAGLVEQIMSALRSLLSTLPTG